MVPFGFAATTRIPPIVPCSRRSVALTAGQSHCLRGASLPQCCRWIALTARHATSTWEYFIDGELVASFDDGGAQPPDYFSHDVDLSGYSGEQTILARWNVADTPNAFYNCIDVNVGAL